MSLLEKGELDNIRNIDLLSYLHNHEPYELVRIGANNYQTRTHNSLKISNGMWYWFSRNIGGVSALDYLIKVKEMRFKDAVELLSGKEFPVYASEQFQSRKKQLLLPPKDNTSDRLVAYIAGRGIDRTVIEECLDRNLLYQSTRPGCSFSNAVFVGYDETGKERFACIRGLSDERLFYGDAPGSDKRYSFSVTGAVNNSELHIFESAIDLLSYATIAKLEGHNWQALNMLSLSGVYIPKDKSPKPLALEHYLEKHKISALNLHLDSDQAGRLSAQAIAKHYCKRYSVIDNPPPVGKDMNDYLKHIKGIRSCSKRQLLFVRRIYESFDD